jgi:Rod binding domain-containing protein
MNAATALPIDPGMARALPKPNAAGEAQAEKVSREFEAMFLGQMLNHMFSGLKTDGVFGGGEGEKMFRSMQVEEFAKSLTQRGGIGIAAAVKREILKMQEHHS